MLYLVQQVLSKVPKRVINGLVTLLNVQVLSKVPKRVTNGLVTLLNV